jgi:kinesin family member 5
MIMTITVITTHSLSLTFSYCFRSVASTRMNADSSRSHSVFIITTEQNETSAGVKKLGRLFLVDLAGSETVSKTNATGQTLQVR